MLRITDHPILGQPVSQTTVFIDVEGRTIEALEGEPVAAAMLAAGMRIVRTMPETGSPRGIFTAVGRSIEELGTVNGEANTPLMSTPVSNGMTVAIQRGLGDWEGAK